MQYSELKKSPKHVFSYEYCEIIKNSFFTELLRFLLLHFLQVINQLLCKGMSVKVKEMSLLWSRNIFSSQHISERHIVRCIKSRTPLFTNLSSIFPESLNNLIRLYPIKLKTGMFYHMFYHVLTKTFRNTIFLDICQCALNEQLFFCHFSYMLFLIYVLLFVVFLNKLFLQFLSKNGSMYIVTI